MLVWDRFVILVISTMKNFCILIFVILGSSGKYFNDENFLNYGTCVHIHLCTHIHVHIHTHMHMQNYLLVLPDGVIYYFFFSPSCLSRPSHDGFRTRKGGKYLNFCDSWKEINQEILTFRMNILVEWWIFLELVSMATGYNGRCGQSSLLQWVDDIADAGANQYTFHLEATSKC